MGRPPKPTVLKVLNGSAAHHPERRNPEEPQVDALTEVPEPPFRLTGRARAAWDNLAPQAVELGVLTSADLYALAETCVAFAKAHSTGRAEWHRAFMTGLGRFGLTPSDRARVHVATKGNDDRMAGLMQPKRRTG